MGTIYTLVNEAMITFKGRSGLYGGREGHSDNESDINPRILFSFSLSPLPSFSLSDIVLYSRSRLAPSTSHFVLVLALTLALVLALILALILVLAIALILALTSYCSHPLTKSCAIR